MLVRLRDFAEINRVAERTVQLHVKNNWEELKDHVDRRGKQGTWLDEYAQEFLLGVVRLPTKDEVLVPSPREAALMLELKEVTMNLAAAERRAAQHAEAAGKVALLAATTQAQSEKITELAAAKGMAEQALEDEKKDHEVDNAAKDALIERLQLQLENEKVRPLTLKERLFGKKGKV